MIMAIVRDEITRRARKNGAARVHFRLFSFARPFSRRLPLCPAALCQRDRTRKESPASGDGATETPSKGDKKGRIEARRERRRGTVRSDASRRRGEKEPATSQPDCKTLCKTRRESQDDWFVRPFTARPIFCHPARCGGRPRKIYARARERGVPSSEARRMFDIYFRAARLYVLEFWSFRRLRELPYPLRSPNWRFSYRVSVRATPVERLHTQLRNANADKAGYARE